MSGNQGFDAEIHRLCPRAVQQRHKPLTIHGLNAGLAVPQEIKSVAAQFSQGTAKFISPARRVSKKIILNCNPGKTEFHQLAYVLANPGHTPRSYLLI